jgi:ABC-type multidrug transport system fused ATPase/permease subunit
MDRELASQDVYRGKVSVLLARLWRDYLAKHKLRLLFALLASMTGAGIGLCFPMTMRFLFDKVLLGGPIDTPEKFHARLTLAIIYLCMNSGIWIISLLSQWTQSWLILSFGQRLVFNLRRDLNEKLHNLHIGFYERTPAGRIMSRLLDDVDVIRHWVAGRLIEFFSGITRLVIGTVLAFYLNWKIALVVFAVMPFYFLTIYLLRPRVRRANITLRRLNSSMYARAAERIGGMPVIRAFARERGELKSFAGVVHDYVRVGNRLVVYNQGMSLIAGSISAIAAGVVVYLAAMNVQKGLMSVGDLVAFQRLLNHMFDPIQNLTNIFIQFQALLVVLHRVFNLLDEKVEVVSGEKVLSSVEWPLRVENVTLRYPGQENPSLDNVSLTVNKGERIAIMGSSGSGKSSLFQLLLRFYDPTSGSISLGTQNIKAFDAGSLRRRICMVQQEPFIFSGTLRENILYGRLDATKEQVEKAAQLAEIHDFIVSLPKGYETEVGERGISLSGGQKQRLALATALLTDPDILLLDDITSSLDADTELQIRGTLRRSLAGRTSLIITQRIVMAQDCDRIVVLDDGRVEAVGTHDSLVKLDGFYRTICEKQGWM